MTLRPLATVLFVAVACGPAPEGPLPDPDPVRIGLPALPTTLDPHQQDDLASYLVLSNIFESLTDFDPSMHIRPGLATGWDNPDDRTWRFQIRPGVTFHDGRPLTAEDVVWSLERARNHARSAVSGYLVAVESVRSPAPLTVEIVTRQPYPILANKLAFMLIVPRGSPETIERPIGTGPFRLGSIAKGGGVTLEAYPGYWRGRPSVLEAELQFFPTARERVHLLLSGELDLVSELPTAQLAQVREAPATRIESAPSLTVHYLQTRVGRPPFDDVRVRRAIHLALDRPRLVDELLDGQGQPASQLVTPDVFGFAAGIRSATRDLPEARRLLAAAGYAEGLDLELEYREGRRAQPIVDQLAEAGIRVTLAPAGWRDLYHRLQDGEVPFYLGSWFNVSGDASDLFDSKVHSVDHARGYGDSNSSRFSDSELDRLIEASGTTLGMVERREILEACMERLNEELPLIPLVVPLELYGVRSRLLWSPRLDGRIQLAEMTVRQPGTRPSDR